MEILIKKIAMQCGHVYIKGGGDHLFLHVDPDIQRHQFKKYERFPSARHESTSASKSA